MYRRNQPNQFIYFVLISPSTGLAVTGASVSGYVCLDGGNQTLVAGTITEKGNGQYCLAFAASDLNGFDVGVSFVAANALPVFFNIVTTTADPTNPYNFGITNIDVFVSSRLASISYIPPPTAATIAAYFWAEAPPVF